MITSSNARNILEERYPLANIEEVSGNPNMLGWFAFTINGTQNVFVTDEGEIVVDEEVARD